MNGQGSYYDENEKFQDVHRDSSINSNKAIYGINHKIEDGIPNRFSSQNTSIKDFQILQKLGEGSYSSVYKVVRK